MGWLEDIKNMINDAIANVERATGIDIPGVGTDLSKEKKQKEGKKEAQQAKVEYVFETTNKKGETVLVATPTATPTQKQIEEGKVIATGLEAKAMSKVATGYARGMLGHNYLKTYNEAKQRYIQVQQKQQKLEQKIKNLQNMAQKIQTMNPNSPEYVQKVQQYNMMAQHLQAEIEKFNKEAIAATLRYAEEAGGVQGYEAYLARQHDPMEVYRRKVMRIYREGGPLRALAFGLSTGLLTWSDPLGIRSTVEGIMGWWKGGVEERNRRVLNVKAEALRELETRLGKNPQEMQEKLTQPGTYLNLLNTPIATPLVAYGIGAGTGALTKTAQAIPKVGGAISKGITTGLTLTGATIAYKTVAEPIQKGEVGKGLANLAVLGLSMPMAVEGYRAGYTGIEKVSGAIHKVYEKVTPPQVRTHIQNLKYYLKNRSEIDAINEAFENYEIKKPTTIERPTPKKPPTFEDLARKHLENIDVSRMLKAYDYLMQKGRVKEAQEILSKVEKILQMREKVTSGITRRPPRSIAYEEWVERHIYQGRDYYGGLPPYREVTITKTIPKVKTKVPNIYKPVERDLAILRGAEETVNPAEALGLDRLVTKRVRILEPTVPVIPISMLSEATTTAQKPAQLVKVKPLQTFKTSLKTLELPATVEKQVQQEEEGTKTITTPSERTSTKVISATIPRTTELTIKVEKLKMQKPQKITAKWPKPYRFEFPKVLFPLFPSRKGLPRKRWSFKVNFKKPAFKKPHIRKSLLADLLSVTESHAWFGRATHPKPTKSIWILGEKTFFIRVPTKELLKRGAPKRIFKTPSKKKGRKRRRR